MDKQELRIKLLELAIQICSEASEVLFAAEAFECFVETGGNPYRIRAPNEAEMKEIKVQVKKLKLP